jgi:hypothetical protein
MEKTECFEEAGYKLGSFPTGKTQQITVEHELILVSL